MKKLLLTTTALFFVSFFSLGQNTTLPNGNAGQNASGNNYTFIGDQSGINNSGDENTFVGRMSGGWSSGGNNSIFGSYSGIGNTGDYNVFFGMNVGEQNSGNHNVLLGYKVAGLKTNSGPNNVAIGAESAFNNTTGQDNVFVGRNSGNGNTIGNNNTFLGNISGLSNTTGNRNTYIGNESGANAQGSDNVFIGHKAGFTSQGDNKLYIENSDATDPLIEGDFAADIVNINGKLAVGVKPSEIPTDYHLAIAGKIISEEVKVKLRSTGWPDYVFSKDYNLPTLKAVAQHIEEKGHLENIPSAEDVSKNGISLGEMNAKLLEKIEELTLYTIQQQKEIEGQKEENKTLNTRLVKIEKALEKLND